MSSFLTLVYIGLRGRDGESFQLGLNQTPWALDPPAFGVENKVGKEKIGQQKNIVWVLSYGGKLEVVTKMKTRDFMLIYTLPPAPQLHT